MNRLIPILLLSLAACAELDPPTLIKRDRVLAAKVTVDGHPERAWPLRGERATVTWLTASPGATPTFSWVLAACPAATSSGMPGCSGAVFATATGAGLSPTLSVTVPVEMNATAVVVTGAICASGAPVVDAASLTAECDDGSRADVVSQHIFIADDQATNQNPNIAAAPFTFDGAQWDSPDGAAACDGTLPVVKAGSKRRLVGVTFDASDREAFMKADATPSREDLQLAAFATAGEIIQQHTYVDADDERAVSPVALEWDPPDSEDVPAGGLRVKFFFVVRDMRGGVDATSRELCVQ
jgi:hypothetical protein